MEGQMGGSPKALRQHLVGETSLLGDYRSPTEVARAIRTKILVTKVPFTLG